MTDSHMSSIKEKWQEFNDWQRQPYTVAPMSDEEHVCATCDTEYQGNFCPRCGQSAKVLPKMSLWKTFLLFLDVWGLGNRGMFRTLRDLILRPGYLICDYIRGKHGAYFPPFKLLFLLTTLSIIVGQGWNLEHFNYIPDTHYEEDYIQKQSEGDKSIAIIYRSVNVVVKLQHEYPALYQIVFMLYASLFLFMMFKKSKVLGTFDFHEFFIAMLYMVNMSNIYSIIFKFFGLSNELLTWAVLALYLIPLKQISGYGWGKTLWRFFVSILISIVSLFLITVVVCFIVAYIFNEL